MQGRRRCIKERGGREGGREQYVGRERERKEDYITEINMKEL